MKKLLFLLIFIVNIAEGQDYLNQKIDFESSNTSLNEALVKLSKQLNLDIAFNPNLLGKETLRDFQYRQETLASILDAMLKGKAAKYRMIGNKILLFKKPSYSYSGFVEDKANGERLIGATVYCPQLQKGTISNEYGFYSLSLPEGEYQLSFSYIGYEAIRKKINLNKSYRESIRMSNALTLAPVIVTPDDHEQDSIFTDKRIGDPVQITQAMAGLSPQLGGVVDPIRTAQLTPGINAGPDGLDGPLVRGSNSGHNLMLLDGAPIYIPYHLMGLYSVYNQSVVRSTRIYKGSFPARYGGRLASVFDVRTREGNLYQWSGEASFNLLNANFLLEGPIKVERAGLLLATRLSYTDFLFNPFFKNTFFRTDSEDISTWFNDWNAKFHYKISDRDKLYLSFYRGKDNIVGSNEYIEKEDDLSFKEEEEIALSWSNTLFTLRWNHLFSPHLFANTTLTYSQFSNEYSLLEEFTSDNEEVLEALFFSNAQSFNGDIGLSTDFDYIPEGNHSFRFGAGLSFREFIPQLTYLEDEDLELEEIEVININTLKGFVDGETLEALESFLYFEDKLQVSPNWQIELGLRVSGFRSDDRSFFRLEPRLFSQLQISPDLAIHGSFSRMVQYLHLISYSSIRLPSDLWLPSTDNLEPGDSWQGELGFSYEPIGGTVFSATAYHKSMQNLYTYSDDFDFLADDFFAELVAGEGKAAGIELAIRQNGRYWGGMLSYARTETERQFDKVNMGLPFVHAYDQPHRIKSFLYFKPNDKLNIALNWVYNSASPDLIIAPLGSDSEISGTVDETGRRHQTRLNDYHRLDLNLSYELNKGRLKHHWSLGAYNLYNRANRTYTRLDFDELGNLNTRPIFGLGFRPSFSYRLSF